MRSPEQRWATRTLDPGGHNFMALLKSEVDKRPHCEIPAQVIVGQ